MFKIHFLSLSLNETVCLYDKDFHLFKDDYSDDMRLDSKDTNDAVYVYYFFFTF